MSLTGFAVLSIVTMSTRLMTRVLTSKLIWPLSSFKMSARMMDVDINVNRLVPWA